MTPRKSRLRGRVLLLAILTALMPMQTGTLHAQGIVDSVASPSSVQAVDTVTGLRARPAVESDALAPSEEIREKGALPRFPGRTIVVSLGGGLATCFGDFESALDGPHAAVALGYAVYPQLTVLLTADIGKLSLTRDISQVDPILYQFQFLRETDPGPYDRGIDVVGIDLSTRFSLFPYRYYNLFLSLGAGVTFYKAEDFSDVRIRPTADFPASITIPVGIGGEWYFTRDLALSLQLRNAFLFRGDLDAFDPEELAMEYNRQRPTRVNVPSAGGDQIFSVTLGIQYTLFERTDYDSDLLENQEEAELGTDPYEIDTDIDGLTDYEEVRVHSTSPIKPDTDDDGLGDYFEITKYGTDPLKPDTDEDRLSDVDEVMVYNTDPRKPDTDDDMLGDYEEVILYQTNPRNPDTDFDGLDDFAEVKVHETDPLRPDTDDDGIYDFNEIVTYKTNPGNADTDDDRLLDYDEIAYYGTSPLNPDTDGDHVEDATEVFGTRTNPLDQDQTVAPADKKPFAERPRYNAELLETRQLPGGGTSYLIAPVLTRRPPRAPENLDSVVAALTVIDSTFGSGPGESSAEAYARYRRRSIQHVNPAEEGVRRPQPLRLDSLRLRAGDILSFCNISFEFDRDALQEEYLPLLREAAQLFRSNPGMVVEIRGHTDTDGEEEYNQLLSERRSRNVHDFIVTQGIAANRLRTVGFGERQPIADSATDEGRARNRRVEFYIVSLQPRSDGGR
ncbi:MAG: OmpA family protein [Bacteroidota bacterium]|jgi:outer membrane protein OmpA-like peptidoglycan-associated protein